MTRHDLEAYAMFAQKENSLRLRLQQLIEAAKRLRACVDEIQAQREHVKVWVDSLPPAQRAIITARYLDGLDWQAVAREVGYGLSQCHNLHRAALERLETA